MTQAPIRNQDSPLDTVLAYWETLRGGRTAPARAEIDPAAIARALESCCIAEIVAPGVARFRLAGRAFGDLVGMEPRGMPLSCLFSPSARAELARAILHVGQGARVMLPLRGERQFLGPDLSGDILLLPLADHTGAITRLLGVIQTRGRVTRPGRRFDLAGPETRHAPSAQPPVAPSPQTPPRPALRVIEGGKR
jgi:hypothetical protein